MAWLDIPAGKHFLLSYHTGEEFLIGLICFIIAFRAFSTSKSRDPEISPEKRSRIFLVGSGFTILGCSSTIHALIHAVHLNQNLLYQTLVGYCFGLFIIILAISVENPGKKKTLPLLYIPLLALLHPGIYERFPVFGEFRPLVWIMVAYLSGVACMLYIGTFYRMRSKRFLVSAAGHLIICMGAIFLFFPAPIGSTIWLHGHIMRPVGFLILLFSMSQRELLLMEGSLLYRALASFSFLAAIPLLSFGTFVFYDNISPITIIGRRLMIFLLLLITLISALFFGLGMIIRLIRPILQLKKSVNDLAGAGLSTRIPVHSSDEIGELSGAFNDMLARLGNAIGEQERMCRLAATGELAATLAHEIKNPLNAIGGAATYIEKNVKGSHTREFVAVIASEVSRINKLTTTLLSFARPVTPELESTDLNRVVEESLALLKEESSDQQVSLRAELAREPLLVDCDRNQIKQVLLNLILNAFDSVKADGVVQVTTRRTGEGVYLVVRDNGCGIPADILAEIFNPFFTTKTRGTGLGLAISKKIVQEHGGDLTVSSTPGEGSVFTLVFQRKEPD